MTAEVSMNMARPPALRTMRSTGRWLVAAMALSLCWGCRSVGPGKLVSSHEGYNDAVQLTVAREVLKNIVRKRYADPMQFLSVSTINAQFSVSSGAQAGVGGLGTGAVAGQAGGNVGFSESPTITFVPQSDAAFAKSLDSPVAPQEALSQLFHWGSFRAHEVGLLIGAINYASDRSGPRGEAYRSMVDAWLRLMERGALSSFREFYPRHAGIAPEQVDGRAYVYAAQSGFYFYDEGDGKLQLASKHLGIGMVFPLPHSDEVVADLELLGLTPNKRIYPVRGTGEAEPEPFGLQPDTLWIAPRSVEVMIELAANCVEVPAAHEQSQLAPPEGPASNSSVELPLRIRHSVEPPMSAYRIQHRGYWFYIDDHDPSSKRLFSMLVEAYSSRIGSKTSSEGAPQIVLPVSG